jgi:hypothetical protein
MRIPNQSPPRVRGNMSPTASRSDGIEPCARQWRSECKDEHLVLTTGGTGQPVKIFLDYECTGSATNLPLVPITIS